MKKNKLRPSHVAMFPWDLGVGSIQKIIRLEIETRAHPLVKKARRNEETVDIFKSGLGSSAKKSVKGLHRSQAVPFENSRPDRGWGR